MTSRNDITGDAIQTKGSSDAYREGWDRIFGKKEEPVFHLRSYGDVPAADLETYAQKRQTGYQYTPKQVEEMAKPWVNEDWLPEDESEDNL